MLMKHSNGFVCLIFWIRETWQLTIAKSKRWKSKLPSTILFFSPSLKWKIVQCLVRIFHIGFLIVIQSFRFFLLSFPHSCDISTILFPLVLVKRWTSKCHCENLIPCRRYIVLWIIFWVFSCVYLLSEISQIPELSRSVFTALPLVGEACQYRHYTHHVVFLETVCKQLPLLAKGIGKKAFKSSVEEFLDPVFYALVREIGMH